MVGNCHGLLRCRQPEPGSRSSQLCVQRMSGVRSMATRCHMDVYIWCHKRLLERVLYCDVQPAPSRKELPRGSANSRTVLAAISPFRDDVPSMFSLTSRPETQADSRKPAGAPAKMSRPPGSRCSAQSVQSHCALWDVHE